jgi:hypothetical protein
MVACMNLTDILAMQSATNPAINDKSSSNYFDLGNVRIQWGVSPGGSQSQTVTLPAEFKDANYSITMTLNGSSVLNVFSLTCAGRTTTTFTGYITYLTSNNSTVLAASGTFNWIAIGLKP